MSEDDSSGQGATPAPPAAGRGGLDTHTPVWFQRYGSLLDQMLAKQEEYSAHVAELGDMLDTKEQNYVWKKEGLKRQNDVAQKVIKKQKGALNAFDQGQMDRARTLVEEGMAILNDRVKDLKIADISEAGWETVNVYKSHLVAADSEDDKKIRKADKEAVDRLAAKHKSKGRFRPYNRRYQSNRGSYNPGYSCRAEYNNYRSMGGDRSLDAGQRTSYVPER